MNGRSDFNFYSYGDDYEVCKDIKAFLNDIFNKK